MFNATFYKLPTEKAIHTWVAETPDDFVFAIKASRYMTHVYRLTDAGLSELARLTQEWSAFADAMTRLLRQHSEAQ